MALRLPHEVLMVAVLGGLLISVALVLLNGISAVVESQTLGEDLRGRTWRLSWNMVDQGVVSWGTEGATSSAEECAALRDEAIKRKTDELKRRGSDVSENAGTIVEKRPDDKWVLTVVRFMCHDDRPWTMLATHQSRRGTTSEQRMGTFATQEQCIEAVELEATFKAKSLLQFGDHVSVSRLSPVVWSVLVSEGVGTESGQLKAVSGYTCIVGAPDSTSTLTRSP